MAHYSYEEIIKKVLHQQAAVIAEEVKVRLEDFAEKTMDAYYDAYEQPKVYYRTDNLRNSWKSTMSRKSRSNTKFSRSVAVTFSTENMKWDTHAKANGSTPYEKADVMKYTFDQGYRGNADLWPWSKTHKRFRPSPAKRMEKELDQIDKEFNFGLYDMMMEEAFDRACADVANRLDKMFNQKR